MLVRPLLPDSIAVCERLLEYRADEVAPEEWQQVAAAVPKRQREFATGRACARAALGCLGIESHPLLPDAQRVPCWPDAVVGSISHTDDYCAAAVGHRTRWLGIGIDVELATPLDRAIEPLVCSTEERAWLDRATTPEDRGVTAKLVFSAKEAAYKCHYPISRVFFDFLEMALRIDLEAGIFCAILRKDAGSRFKQGYVLEGRYRIADGRIATAVVISA